jgi:type I restriction enzyme S subunit
MTPHDLIEAFEALTEAPEGVVRLRELILRLAVRGHLVPQDPADEPATELVQRARAEQSTLVSSKAIPAPPPTVEIGAEDAPYEVPCGWVWAPLGHVVAVLDFMRRPIKEEERDVRIFGKPQSALYPYYGATQQAGWIDEYIFNEELVLLGEDGAPFFKPGKDVAYVVSGRYWVNNHAHALRGLGILNPYLRSVLNQTSYDGFVSGTTRPKLTQGKMVQLPVPVPPLAEQKRIVARVDELMALLDRLEAAHSTREATRAAVRDSALAALRGAGAPEEVEVAWNRFAERMDDLVIDPSDIPPLRQTVLELAVRGRLVPQDPNDETASALLERIAAEKARFIGNGKGRRPRASLPMSAADVPFGLPSGWSFVRFGDVFLTLLTGPFGTSLKKSEYRSGGTPVINPQNIRAGEIVPLDETCVGEATLRRLVSFCMKVRDIVVARRGEMGRCAVVGETEDGWLCGTGSLLLRPPSVLDPQFVALFLRCPSTADRLSDDSVGATMRNLNQRIMVNLPLGLPPLAEQGRIVTRVRELTALLDRLEERLAAARTTHAAFAAAAVHHLDA